MVSGSSIFHQTGQERSIMKKQTNKKRNTFLTVALAVLVLVLGCTAVQQTQTGRRQLTLFPESEINAAAMASYGDVKESAQLITSGRHYRILQEVGGNIAEVSEKPDYEWEFILIDSDTTVNAWCMPGGKVAVYTGILPVAYDNMGLAAIIGHEIAHALARHANERASQGTLANLAGAVLDNSLEGKKNKQMWMAAFGLGVNVGILLPYSRTHESEADEIGLSLMARAGYDPGAAPELWDRMAEQNESRPLAILSTHPHPEARAIRLRELLPQAVEEYDSAPAKRQVIEL